MFYMKKFFTLAIVALFAMGANAQEQYEKNWDWQAVDADGNINPVLGNETDGWNKEVNVDEANYSIYLLNNSNPGETITPNLTSDNWDVYQTMSYSTQNVMIDTYDESGTNVGNRFYAVCGTGVPCVKFIGEAKVKDGDPELDENGNQIYYVPQRESDGTKGGYIYYVPDGSMGAPTVGPFMTLTAKAAGEFKVGIWANKGGSRALYIVDRATGKALNPWGDAPEYHAEGWVQNFRQKNTADGAEGESLVYLNPMPIDANYVLNATDSIELAKYNNFNIGNQRKVCYLVFNAEAGKSYTIMGNNWQLGFQGVKFTAGTNGIENISDPKQTFNENAPIYNLAGQRVSKSYRGVVVQDGRKFVQR